MDLPEDVTLPMFSYGLFKPGQLGYFRVDDAVEETQEATIEGDLLERDGVPILDIDGHYEIEGYIIEFQEGLEESAYNKVVKLEPEKQYRWETRSVSISDEERQVNVLVGRNPTRGTTDIESVEWNGRSDPLFTEALDVVREVLESNPAIDWENKKPFFRLQMAYLLLWSSLERYISLRYGLRGVEGEKSIHAKLMKLADEPGFLEGLQKLDLTNRPKTRIIRADRPQEHEKLDTEDPQGSIEYYYQVRSNLSHRGKSAKVDFEILRYSLEELHQIFTCYVLPEAFGDDPERNPSQV